MTKLLKYLKPYSFSIFLLFVCISLQSAANLSLPNFMSMIVNEGIIAGEMGKILSYGGLMLLITLGGGLAMVAVSFLAARISTGFARALRARVFEKVESFSMVEFDQFSTASLITRCTNDIQQIQMVVVMVLRIVLMAPIMGFGAVFMAINKSPKLSLVLLVSVGLLIAVISILFSATMPRFKKLQKLVDRLNLTVREHLTGLRIIRAFNNEAIQEEIFEKTNEELTDTNLFLNRLLAMMNPVMNLILNFTTVFIVFIGSRLIAPGVFEVGDLMAFLQYAVQVIFSFLMISMVFIMIPRASVSAVRIAEVLDTDVAIKDPAAPKQTPADQKGYLEFRDVSFAYPDADDPVLTHISFSAGPGQTVAFIGSTGSGKSTLINLIPRFFDVSSGQILIDGVDIREMTMKHLREKIGYIPQKSVLFSGTIASNIKYGAPNATGEELDEAAAIAQAEEFIQTLDEKYDTNVAQGGTNFSGGQKQRLSIARAVVKKPEFYIFDDSFSALDFKTDAALRRALSKVTKNSTVFIVAQRISTIMQADQIIVLDQGKIVGKGTHKELLNTCEVYQEIALSQLSKEELA